MLRYNEMSNVGTARYVVNFHDGEKTHPDGSAFFDLRVFQNKRAKDAFIASLIARGYTRETP